MGMFDYVRSEIPMPDYATQSLLQTKDTPDQMLTVYTIKADGTLWWRPYITEEVSKSERPHPDDDGILGLAGSIRRVEQEPEQLTDYHGDMYLCDIDDNETYWLWRARFTEGVCTSIITIEGAAA